MDEITRTIVIFNEFGEAMPFDDQPRGLAYFVFDGMDLRYLNLKYINSTRTTPQETQRIAELIYDEEGYKALPYAAFPVDQIHEKTAVVEFGILP